MLCLKTLSPSTPSLVQVKDGFFIEAGADDFETDSNTLLFELEHNWTGILVEPNPTIFPKGWDPDSDPDSDPDYDPDPGSTLTLALLKN